MSEDFNTHIRTVTLTVSILASIFGSFSITVIAGLIISFCCHEMCKKKNNAQTEAEVIYDDIDIIGMRDPVTYDNDAYQM